MRTGRKSSQIARGPAPRERDAAAAIVKAPTTERHVAIERRAKPPRLVQPVHEDLGEPLLVGPDRARPVHRDGVVMREPVLDHLASRCEVQPGVVDDERRREDEQEDEPEAGEEDDEDVLLLRDSPEASLPDRPGVRHRV